MKIRNLFLLTSLIIFFISSTSLSQTDTSKAGTWNFKYEPKFAGGQVEAVIMPPLLGELGGLLDVDLFRNKDVQNHYIGLRLAVELYGYGSPGGQSETFGDICVYGRTSLRFSEIRIDAYLGLSYHTGNREAGGILPRGGLEAKYIPFGNYFVVMLKGSTSFKRDSGFYGFGIAFGYFN